MQIKSETKPLVSIRAKAWCDSWQKAASVMEQDGFPAIKGAPLNGLYDTAEIATEASAFAQFIMDRERKAQKRDDMQVSWQFLYQDGGLVVEASYPDFA